MAEVVNINFLKRVSLSLIITFFLISCSIGTHLKPTQVKSYKGVFIPELSSEPILIERISKQLISNESRKTPLNLPLSLLNYEPSSYEVGIGDVLFIYVYGETERLSASLARGAAINPVFSKKVRDDGTIFYPNAGVIDVKGKNIEEIRLILTDKLSDVLNNPQVDVSVTEFNSQRIVISGNFSNVGTIPITLNPVTLNEVIANANPYGSNGTFSNGDLTSLKLSRDGVTYDIDFEYLSRTSLIQNYIYLKDKDVIFLPDNSLSQVHVLGEANSPTSITLRRKNISLSHALATSQGLNQSTSRGKEVYVFRPKDYEGKPRIFKSNISSPTGYLLASDFLLQAEDIVFIGTAGVTSWSRFVSQLLPFTNFINSAESTELIKN